MSLYDDEDALLGAAAISKDVSGWSRGVKLMESQMQLKKATNSLIAPGKNKKLKAVTLAPVIDLNSSSNAKKADAAAAAAAAAAAQPDYSKFTFNTHKVASGEASLIPLTDPKFNVANEYDPMWPNEYEKVTQEMRSKKSASGQSVDDEEPDEKRRRYTEQSRHSARDRFARDGSPGGGERRGGGGGGDFPGFGGRRRDSDDDEDDARSRSSSRRTAGSTGGAAIAPPPSLTESSGESTNNNAESNSQQNAADGSNGARGLGFAAKIMAKYGYKKGQGLGRNEQGMSSALNVEKTSKRGGRIIHEKELMPPPNFGLVAADSPPPTNEFGTTVAPDPAVDITPPRISSEDVSSDNNGVSSGDHGEYGAMPPPPAPAHNDQPKPSITDIMRNPSKVVLCKNMVGPGEVDEELEPEVQDECATKYGDVVRVKIQELQNVVPEETVRIFIEFKRVESAVKAVIDLNGRFFGGREVNAAFYSNDKFSNDELNG